MRDETQARIFPAAERGIIENEWFRCLSSFVFGRYRQEGKHPFGPLYLLNEDILDAGRSTQLLVEKPSLIFMLPLTGAVEYTDSAGNELLLKAGESALFPAPANTARVISNPYEQGWVNYLEVWIYCPEAAEIKGIQGSFQLESQNNQLLPLFKFPSCNITASLGQFKGHEELVYRVQNSGNGLFAMVLQGAFEVQHRLLEPRDGLAIWQTDEVELEALSEQAILLLIELPHGL